MPAGVGTGTKQKGRRRIRREISRGFPESGNNGAEKAITGVLHQNWDETQNWNWRKSMPACFLMTVRKKEDLDRRRSAEELEGVEGGEVQRNLEEWKEGKALSESCMKKNLLSTKENV